MSILCFAKYQGAGNDFILIDDRSGSFCVDPKRIRRLCDRRLGIGADGFILLQSATGADFGARIFNSDGSEATSCGNGLRCLGRFITDLGYPPKPYHVSVGGKGVRICFEGDSILIDLGAPKDLRLNLNTERGAVHFANTGVPHAVVFVDAFPVDFAAEGAYFRRHDLFAPHGANVNFAALQEDGSIAVRTFEKGVEGETHACGTGACAVVWIARALFGIAPCARVVFLGGILSVIAKDSLVLSGPAVKVFSGTLIENN